MQPPDGKTIKCRTTNKEGCRKYRSYGKIHGTYGYLSQCTAGRNHVKTVTRHIPEDYMETPVKISVMQMERGICICMEKKQKGVSLEQQKKTMDFDTSK